MLINPLESHKVAGINHGGLESTVLHKVHNTNFSSIPVACWYSNNKGWFCIPILGMPPIEYWFDTCMIRHTWYRAVCTTAPIC